MAELGAALVLADLGLARSLHPDHASYIAHWLPLLRVDPKALTTAASHASRAAAYLAHLQEIRGTVGAAASTVSSEQNDEAAESISFVKAAA